VGRSGNYGCAARNEIGRRNTKSVASKSRTNGDSLYRLSGAIMVAGTAFVIVEKSIKTWIASMKRLSGGIGASFGRGYRAY
jgi:hypothetical protein